MTRVVHRPPVVAEAGVRGDAAGQPAAAEERVRRPGGRLDPVDGRAAARRPGRAVHGEERHPGPVARRRGEAAAGQRDARAVDGDVRVTGAAECAPQPRDVVGVGAAGRPLAHPVEHLRVGGAVGEPGARRHAGTYLAQQRPRVGPGREAGHQPGGEAVGVAVVLDPVDAGGHREQVDDGGAVVARARQLRDVAGDGVVSASAPSRTARPTRWASTDLVIEAPRNRVSAPSPSAYHSWTTVPSSSTSRDVDASRPPTPRARASGRRRRRPRRGHGAAEGSSAPDGGGNDRRAATPGRAGGR